MEKLAAKLHRSKIFQAISPDTLREQLLPHGQVREYAKGACIFAAQDRVDAFSIVLSGRIHTLHLFADGGCSVTGALEAGYLLGLDLVCTKTRIAPYHAVAAAPSAVFSLPADLLLQPGPLPEALRISLVAESLFLVANFNMQKEYRLAILSQSSLRGRILTYLTMQANRRHTATFTAPFSRQELASFLCVNRSALSHQLSLMKREGLIDYSGNTFTLLNWTPEASAF